MKTRVAATAALALVIFSIGALISCSKSESPQPGQPTGQTAQTSTTEQPPPRNPDRNAYFGEEHIHTSWSVDAWMMGNRITGPDEAIQVCSGPNHQASHGLRHHDRHANGLHGRDRPLRVRGCNQGSEHPGHHDQQDARGEALNSSGSQQRRRNSKRSFCISCLLPISLRSRHSCHRKSQEQSGKKT